MAEILVAHQESNPLIFKERIERIVDDSVIGEYFQNHTGQDCPGEKVRYENNRLDCPLIPVFRHFIQHQG